MVLMIHPSSMCLPDGPPVRGLMVLTLYSFYMCLPAGSDTYNTEKLVVHIMLYLALHLVLPACSQRQASGPRTCHVAHAGHQQH